VSPSFDLLFSLECPPALRPKRAAQTAAQGFAPADTPTSCDTCVRFNLCNLIPWYPCRHVSICELWALQRLEIQKCLNLFFSWAQLGNKTSQIESKTVYCDTR